MISPYLQAVFAQAVEPYFVKDYCSVVMEKGQPATRIQGINVCVF
jgi:hypothetical protein